MSFESTQVKHTIPLTPPEDQLVVRHEPGLGGAGISSWGRPPAAYLDVVRRGHAVANVRLDPGVLRELIQALELAERSL